MIDPKLLREMIATKTCARCGGRVCVESVPGEDALYDPDAARVLCHQGHSWEFQWSQIQRRRNEKRSGVSNRLHEVSDRSKKSVHHIA